MTDLQTPTTPARHRIARRIAAVALGAGLLVGAAAGVASAKEIGSGGTVGTPATAACNPVTSLGYKGDATTSDTGLATISVNYSVKPCEAGQSVVVQVSMYESANPAVVVYDNPSALLSDKFTVAGVRANFSYTVKVTVADAVTGAPVGSSQIFAAAIRKRV